MELNIGIDLDETLIANKNQYYSSVGKCSSWKIKDSAKKYLPKLSELGYNFHLITARSPSEENDVKHIVEFIEKSLDINFKSITLTDGKEKGIYAYEKQCICMIDDNLDFLSNCEIYNVKPILFGKRKIPHNKSFSQLVACLSWKEVYEFLSNLFGN